MITLDNNTLVIDTSQPVEGEFVVPYVRWMRPGVARTWLDVTGPNVLNVLLDWFDFCDMGIGRIRYISPTGKITTGSGHVKMRPDGLLFHILLRGIPPSAFPEENWTEPDEANWQ